MLKHSGSSRNMCLERDGEAGGLTPRQPALNEFKDALYSLVYLCQTGSLASSSAPSPRDGSKCSRSQSILSDDLSCVPPEEPEWLLKMAAARAYNRTFSGRSRPASRRDSGLSCAAGRVPGGGAAPSPLRNNLSVVTNMAVEEAAGSGCGTPSPRTLDTARQALLDRFGSYEGLSAALDDFYHRLCSDERVGPTIKQVPPQDVWLIMTQLMALSLQQQQHEQLLLCAGHLEDRRLWIRRCEALLRCSAAPAAEDEQDTAVVYDAVMANLLATLERLGALRAATTTTTSSGMQDGEDGGADELAEDDDDESTLVW